MSVVVALLASVTAATEPAPSSLFPLQEGWTTTLPAAPAARPFFGADLAFVPLRDKTLTAVRLQDGQVVWQTEQETRFPPAGGPELVVVAEGATLVARQVEDGQIRWRRQVGSLISAPPLWRSGWLVALLENGEVVVLNGVDGGELWRRQLGGALNVQPAVGGSDLFVSVADGRVVAVSLETGEPRWERTLGGEPQQILPLDAIFVGTTDNYFYRLSRDNGSIDWRWRTGGDIVGVATVDEDRVFFASLDNILRALDRSNGAQRWRRLLAGRPTAGPTLVDDVLLVSGVAPVLRSFEARTGEPSNRLQAPDELAAPPHVINTPAAEGPRLVLTIADGRMVGMRPAFGPPQFTMSAPPISLLAPVPRMTPREALSQPPLSPGPRPIPPGVTSLTRVAPTPPTTVPGSTLPAESVAETGSAPTPSILITPEPITVTSQPTTTTRVSPITSVAAETSSEERDPPREVAEADLEDDPRPRTESPGPAWRPSQERDASRDQIPPGLTVQVAAVRSASNAARLAARLVSAGFDASVMADLPDGLHRVWVGRGLDRSEAERLATRLREEQRLDTFIVRVP